MFKVLSAVHHDGMHYPEGEVIEKMDAKSADLLLKLGRIEKYDPPKSSKSAAGGGADKKEAAAQKVAPETGAGT